MVAVDGWWWWTGSSEGVVVMIADVVMETRWL